MITRPFGVVLMGAVCLAAGLTGIAGFWVATEARVPGTSPLAQLFTLAWSITYILTSVLVWRRSKLAAPTFLAALGFPVGVSWFIAPDGQFFLPSLIVTSLVALFGYRYLQREGRRLA
jgi:hypothetical protein